MSFSFDVRPDTREVKRFLSELEKRQKPFATTLAMTRTAQRGKTVATKQIPKVFDRPARMTRNAVMFTPATKSRQYSTVFIRDEATKGTAPIKYLAPHIYGGARRLKRYERALQAAGILPQGYFTVPGDGAKLNKFGNITAGVITKILSQLRASPDPMQNRPARRRSAQYFIGKRRRSHPFGILQRKGRNVSVILYFIKRQPSYTARFPFHSIVEREARKAFPGEFGKAMRQAIATARSRGRG